MKKIIGLLLTLTMAFSLFTVTPVSAYSDIINREDIEVLSDLGIIDGFEDGTYRAEEDLTRAQLVKIICALMGYEDMSQGNTSYSDVTASHWASGYINQADALDIVAGYEDGTFKPDQKVTYEEAVKMVVCALKYEPAASAVGSGNWYNGYLNVASSLGITKGVNGSVGVNFTRGDMACLIYNALTVQMLDISAWSYGSLEYTKSEDTILSKYLEVEKWEGILELTPYMSYMSGNDYGYADLDANAVQILYDGKKISTDPFQMARCDKNVEDLLGKRVVCYVGEDAKGEWRIFSIAEKDNYNDVMVIKASDIESADVDYVYYENANGKIAKVKLDNSVVYIENYTDVNTFDHTNANGYITLISNNNDNAYDYIIYYNYDEPGSVVYDIEAYDEIISFDANGIDEYDYEDDDVRIVVYKDGELASIEDIEVDDVISVVGTGDFKLYFVSSKNVSGTITKIDNSEFEISIDKEDYAVSPSVYSDLSSFILSNDITAYFNVDDEIVETLTNTVAISKYGMVLRGYKTSDDEYKLEVLFSNGTKGTYIVNDNKVSAINAVLATAGIDLTDSTKSRLTYSNIDKAIFSITTRASDNTVTKLTAAEDGPEIKRKTYDEETMTFGQIDITSSTVLFAVEQATDGLVRSENVTVGKATDFFVDDEGEDFILYTFIPDSKYDSYGILVGTGVTGTVSDKSSAMIVESSIVAYIDSEDDTGCIITGIQDGKEVEYELYDYIEVNSNSARVPEKGDVILLGAKDNGYISKYTLLTTVANVTTYNVNINGKVVEYTGLVNRANTDSTRLVFDGGETLLMKSSANYTLVDINSNGKIVSVEKKSKGVSIFGSETKYTSYAYVRYYDDIQTEIVIYRVEK